ncbi:alanine racemase [Heyndrickxia ginsengihumi]|uniref:alanine racemase n=1 Tax=Heyndrickxia ginsengihumi TaxID=363870 RepID=UPI003D1EB6CB
MNEETAFYRDTWVEIQLDAISENLSNLRNRLPEHVEIIAVVKANAYGHGDVQIAKTALESGATMLAVAFLDEALALRKKGIEAPILVLGTSRPEDAAIAAKHHILLTVFQTNWLEIAKEYLNPQEPLSVHIKCDTGMGRIGVRTVEELEEVERIVEQSACFDFTGIFTHFATADELDTTLFEKQYVKFQTMVSALKVRPKYVHCANSAASLRYDQSNFNAVRFGIAMYGLSPSPEIKPLLPYPLKEAFSLHTKVMHIKKIHPGDTVSYGATFSADKDEWIATLPIGYADGWIRKLQGQEVIVDGEKAPIVGRVCMDQCMIKLSHKVKVGTKVTLIGKQGNLSISVDDIARKLDTINYEVTCSIAHRVPRVYIKKGEIVEISNPILNV